MRLDIPIINILPTKQYEVNEHFKEKHIYFLFVMKVVLCSEICGRQVKDS